MKMKIETILSQLKEMGINFKVLGKNSTVKRLAAIGPDVRESICYYVGNESDVLNGITDSIVFCKPNIEMVDCSRNTYILTDHPQLCFYFISFLFNENKGSIISEKSIIDKFSNIGKNVSIGPFCTIDKSVIGDNVVIESGVKINRKSIIGNNVHIQANSVIGAIGVMWAWDANGKKQRLFQSGNVIIEDDVFIGANVSISKGPFENKPTRIGYNTLISHGTSIGHGCVIGTSNHLSQNVTLAGSVTTGEKCFFGAGSFVLPHINLHNETTVGAGAVVVNNTDTEGLTLVGCPAKELKKNKKNIQSGIPSPYIP